MHPSTDDADQPVAKLLARALQGYSGKDPTMAGVSTRQALALMPASAEGWRVAAYLSLSNSPGRPLQLFGRALAAAPAMAEIRIDMAAMRVAEGDTPGALRLLRRGAALTPGAAALWVNIASAGEAGRQITALRRACAIEQSAQAWYRLGALAAQCAEPIAARRALRRAIALAPADAEAHAHLGLAATDLKQWLEVEQAAGRALAAAPLMAAAWHLLALAGFAQARPDLGKRALGRAVAILPGFASALISRGNRAVNAGDRFRARLLFRRALAVERPLAEAELNIGLLDLLEGNYSPGWQGFARRWQCRSHAGFRWPDGARRWHGDVIGGARLLLRAEPEQALGDTIQFIRFVPQAARRVGAITVECDPALHRLVQTLPGVDRVIGIGEDGGGFEVSCGLMDLGALFAHNLADLAPTTPYLGVETESVEPWRALLADLPRPRIGFCWRGNPKFRLDHLRSPGLAVMRPLFALAGGVISLVYARSEAERLPAGAADPMPLVTDMMDTAGLLSALDLIVSSDTAIVHLAGALALPAWVLLHEPADWRWLEQRRDSPWYPSLRLFRQDRPGDWNAPVEAVAAALTHGLRDRARR